MSGPLSSTMDIRAAEEVETRKQCCYSTPFSMEVIRKQLNIIDLHTYYRVLVLIKCIWNIYSIDNGVNQIANRNSNWKNRFYFSVANICEVISYIIAKLEKAKHIHLEMWKKLSFSISYDTRISNLQMDVFYYFNFCQSIINSF